MKKRPRGLMVFLFAQSLLIVLISMCLLIFFNEHLATSALLGGLVALLPSLFFIKKLFAHQGARAAKKIVNSFYTGEALKLLSSIVLFILVFTCCSVQPVAFFLTYIAVVVSHWFSPLIIKH